MGLDVKGTQFILYAKSLGVDFSHTAMIGRQSLHLHPSELFGSFKKFGMAIDKTTVQRIFRAEGGYAEEFFRVVGAKEVDSFDNSSYEGATHIHDLNQPISEQHKQNYSALCEYGSLEHVFNFPVALKSVMEMVKVGGHYVGVTTANNFLGHGFYQFSPELFYSVFTPANGFELIRLIAFEVNPSAPWYSVKSPLSVKGRVTLVNRKPVYLAVIAKRISAVVPFEAAPQQSDYVSAWRSQQRFSFASTLLHRIPLVVQQIGEVLFRPQHLRAGFSPRFFVPINPTDTAESLDTKHHKPR